LNKKIGVVSLGCPKNLVDSEIMLGLLKNKDYEITNDKSEADIIIVNTCGFIESAKQESINSILEMAECKKQRCELLLVTGCLAERYNDTIVHDIPEVDAVVGVGSYGEIADIIEKAYNAKRNNLKKPVLYGKQDDIGYLENERLISTLKGYAYLKIAEGCDNCCTYCIIPSLRGRYRSRKIEDIVNEAKRLNTKGTKEIILVAQDTTRYGTDIYGRKMLVDLIKEISKIEGIEWIRLLYCYPEEIDNALIEEIAINSKVCKYLDIPIQHASDKILKAMGRRGNSLEIRNLITSLRQRIPDIIIRTSLIVGFPGEDENDFEILYNFVKDLEFDRLGVFTYSKEEDTPAAKLKPQISKKLKERRFNTLMSMQKEIVEKTSSKRFNRIYKSTVEGVAEDGIFYYGRTYGEAPEIDNLIYFTSPDPLEINSFANIRILNTDDYDLIGESADESSE